MYQVLARKYRPKNFHELLGQSHVSTALINGIEQQRLHHAYLFTGTRGVGKTTIARILAKCLNCETGVTSEPCGVCSTCVSIDAGRFIDLIEIDAASRTKVEDTRELLDNVPYAPTQGRYKVYLIDEVHMLSTHSFNALLKTLEEPPAHVKFLLATTDPQKLPITIISRCLQFVLRPIPQTQLADYLAVILAKEHIDFAPDALWQLASSAKGSVRDALSLTDQAIAFGNGNIEPETVKNMLGLIDQADVVGLLLAIVQQQKPQVAQAIEQLREQVVDAKAVFDSMAEVLHHVALLQVLPSFDLQLNSEQTQARQRLAQHISADLLQLYYEIVVQSRENIGLANTPLQALEMCILRLLAFRPLGGNEVAIHAAEGNEIQSNDVQSNGVQSDEMRKNKIAFLQNSNAISDSEILPSLNPYHENSMQSVIPIENIAESPLSNTGEFIPVENIAVTNSALPLLAAIPSQAQPQIPTHFEMGNTNADYENNLHDNTIYSTSQNLENSYPAPTPDNYTQPHFTPNDSLQNEPWQNITSPILTLANNEQSFENSRFHDTISVDAIAVNEVVNTPSVPDKQGDFSENIVVNNQDMIGNNTVEKGDVTGNDNAWDISPLDLLIPEPQEIVGEWTPQKWDYWVHLARVQGWLAEDELVLAKRGVMTGDIAGESQFLSDKNSLSNSRTFSDLCQKLATHFPSMQVTLEYITPQSKINLATDAPETHQSTREQNALVMATQKIQQLPVMQALLNQNAQLQNVVLNKTPLTLGTP